MLWGSKLSSQFGRLQVEGSLIFCKGWLLYANADVFCSFFAVANIRLYLHHVGLSKMVVLQRIIGCLSVDISAVHVSLVASNQWISGGTRMSVYLVAVFSEWDVNGL